VCAHVAARAHKILQAVRTEPLEKADSGWQLLCNSGLEEKVEDAKIWTIREVLDLEPSLIDWVDAPVGTTLWRPTASEPWQEWKDHAK